MILLLGCGTHEAFSLGLAQYLDAVALIQFGELHADEIAGGRGKVLADVIRADRQLAVAAIHQDGELNHRWPAEIHQSGEGGADGAACGKNVVDQDDAAAFDIEGNTCGADFWLVGAEIVAEERDVEHAAGHGRAFNARHGLRQTLGERAAFAQNADDGDVFRAAVTLQNFVGDAGPRAAHLVAVHDLGGGEAGLWGSSGGNVGVIGQKKVSLRMRRSNRVADCKEAQTRYGNRARSAFYPFR